MDDDLRRLGKGIERYPAGHSKPGWFEVPQQWLWHGSLHVGYSRGAHWTALTQRARLRAERWAEEHCMGCLR
eukprot:6480527-Amphidinium_carterae.1